MSILINEDTRVIVQGATSEQGRFHIASMLNYNVKVVAGVTPGKGGEIIQEIPIYDTIALAKKKHDIDATMILVSPANVLDAALEAIDNKIKLIVIIAENVPIHDTLLIRRKARQEGINVIGPNTIGIISPGKSKVGAIDGNIYNKGNVGIISRSGTLTHEISSNLKYKGLGQSTCICIGGDPIKGIDFVDALKLFRDDEQTKTIIMIGEIGGAGEELAAKYIKESNYPKRVISFIAGQNAPTEKKMGHAGAIISKGYGTAESKIKSLNEAGITVVKRLDELLELV